MTFTEAVASTSSSIRLLPMIGALAGGATAITLAVLDAGAWAIIGQQIVTASVTDGPGLDPIAPGARA